MASLQSIPLELLVLVSSFLSTPDLGSLRRTCKHIEKLLFDNFAKEFFSKKQFMITSPSLQALIDISKHASLSKQVKHVIIGTDQFSDAPHINDDDACFQYRQGWNDQRALMDSCVGRDMLTEAFLNLPNLETVGIRDFVSRGRLRDGNSFWSSYGATTVFRKTGTRLEQQSWRLPSPPGVFASRLFSMLVYALGKAGRTPPMLEVLLRQSGSGLYDTAFYIPEFAWPTVEPVLAGLNSLLLSLNVNVQQNWQSYTPTAGGPPFLGPALYIWRFLAHTPNLSHLRLNFDKSQPGSNTIFLKWLARAVTTHPASMGGTVSASDPEPVSLVHLRRIDIGMLEVRSSDLLAVIAKFAPTLEALSLWKVTLSIGNQRSGERVNLWSKFLEKLARIPGLELNHFSVGASAQDSWRVSFKTPKDGISGNSQVNSVSYKGLETMRSITELVDWVQVDWPEPAASEDEDEGGNEDDETFEDEDYNEDDE